MAITRIGGANAITGTIPPSVAPKPNADWSGLADGDVCWKFVPG